MSTLTPTVAALPQALRPQSFLLVSDLLISLLGICPREIIYTVNKNHYKYRDAIGGM